MKMIYQDVRVAPQEEHPAPEWYLVAALRGIAELVHQGADDETLLRAWAGYKAAVPHAEA